MNIQFDFTKQNQISAALDNQPVAVMPAGLAQELLRMYAQQLTPGSNRGIINLHIETLTAFANSNDLNGAIKASLAWVAERELIQNIQHENWDAYSVKKGEAVQVVTGLNETTFG